MVILTDIIRSAGAAISRIILGLLHLMGIVLGYLLWLFDSRRRHNTHANINLCFPDLSAREIHHLVRLNIRESGKLLFEALFFWLCPGKFYQHSIRGVVGEEYLLQARVAGCGVILISPHLGNWEVFNAWAGSYSAYVSYKPLSCKWMDRRVRYCRECNGSRLFSINNKGLRVLYSELDKGGAIVLFPDQVPESGGRVMAPFFGISAWTGTLISRLAAKKNITVICGFARRLPHAQGFEIYLQPAPEEIYLSNIEQSAVALNRGMEDCIRRSPEQYTWAYKRFKDCSYKQLYYKSKVST